jgi:peptidoglycan-associated lipoprotein
MKLAKSAQFLAIALACSTALVGCRKGLDKTTLIPSQDKSRIVDSNLGNNGVNGVPAVFDPTKGEGIAAAGGDFTNWKENREEFAAQTVYFDFDKSNIKPGEIKKLEEVVQKMKASFQGKALRIEGHCDERGTEEYNRTLGDRRAQSIREFLVKEGLSPEILPTITFGEDKPADPGHTEEAFKKNRRGELVLLAPVR